MENKKDYPEYYCHECWNIDQVKTVMQPVENRAGASEGYYCPVHKKAYTTINHPEFGDHYLVGGDLDTINSL